MADTPQDRIAALEAELAALRAEMQEFTYTVSHDLRAPLRHIVSYAQLVQEDAGPKLNTEVQGFLATITDSARHMGVLLDGLVALSRLGTVPVAVTAVPLQALVQDVAAQLNERNPGRNIDWRIAGDLPTVLADAALLRQALEHVLGNAVKFTAPREQAVVEITAPPGGSKGMQTLQVRDNGVGYNPAMQAKLFQVFGRLHSAKQFEGIGLGLAMTRKIAQRLEGTVSAQGVLDGGCCVTLCLPVAPAV
jgi:light-regulated signal transduction histidine kinase (bacteriophytochrome)